MDDLKQLREKLKFFMADRNLTIQDVAILINRHPQTVWQFLKDKVNSHDRTVYKIKRLLGEL